MATCTPYCITRDNPDGTSPIVSEYHPSLLEAIETADALARENPGVTFTVREKATLPADRYPVYVAEHGA